MDDEKMREKMRALIGEVKRLNLVVKAGENQKSVLVKELRLRDNFIETIREYMGEDNFNSLIQTLKIKR